MNPTTVSFIIALLELILKYGIPATVEILKTWQTERNPLHSITLADIEYLKGLVPKPETYFPSVGKAEVKEDGTN